MSNYNTTLQSNNTDLQEVLQTLQTKAAGGGEQATPVISVSSNGLITATAGTKSSTHQLAFQAAKTVTPTTTNQIAVSSGYYTGGNIIVAAVPTQTKSVTPKATAQNVTPDSGKFLSKVTVNGDSNLVAGNIKAGVSIFGVSGTLESSGGSSGDASFEEALITRTITSYANSRISNIGSGAFYGCAELATISFPSCITIGSNAFYACSKLTSANFPVCTNIGGSAFIICSKLTSVSFPVATNIDYAAFYACSKLTSVSFPACTSIGNSAFYGCTELATISFPSCRTIGGSAFAMCSKLASANFPVCTNIGGSAFLACSKLSSVSFPACTSIGGYAFSRCYNLTSVSFPACKTVSSSAFYSCSNLTSASFPACTSIGNSAFYGCFNLKALYLTGSTICSLNNSKAFLSTPIGGYSTSAGTYGSIYVPASLLTSYKTTTNWTYFSSRFVGI